MSAGGCDLASPETQHSGRRHCLSQPPEDGVVEQRLIAGQGDVLRVSGGEEELSGAFLVLIDPGKSLGWGGVVYTAQNQGLRGIRQRMGQVQRETVIPFMPGHTTENRMIVHLGQSKCLQPAAVMSPVVTAEITRRPPAVIGESVRGGSDADRRPARFKVFMQQVKLLLGRHSHPDVDDQEIGLSNHLQIGDGLVFDLRVFQPPDPAVDQGCAESEPVLEILGQSSHRLPGAVLGVAGNDDNVPDRNLTQRPKQE